MADSSAKVFWEGRGKQGAGHISAATGLFKELPYGFESRFGEAVDGTNPEELLGAAHAACFSMAISFACDAAGYTTERLNTEARVSLGRDETGFFIKHIALKLRASVPGITAEEFQTIAEKTKLSCPVSRALAAVPEISLDARLE